VFNIALAPTAVLPPPVKFSCKAAHPIAVLAIAVLLLSNAKVPTAVLPAAVLQHNAL
jgi:hypothetical protein